MSTVREPDGTPKRPARSDIWAPKRSMGLYAGVRSGAIWRAARAYGPSGQAPLPSRFPWRGGASRPPLGLAPPMLDVARQRAHDVERLVFAEANVVNLSRFAARSFELVLYMDGAISFCG